MLEIKALGNLTITKDGKTLDPMGSLRAQVLLTFLAIEGGTHNRNYLAAMFWPDSPEEKALTSLRVVLTELRKSVGEFLSINRTEISVSSDNQIYLDVFELETLLKQRKDGQALDLYRGDLLSGVYISGSIEFENWRRWENERIRIMITEHLEESIKNKISLSQYQDTEKLSRSLLKIDPINEFASQYYAIALALSGHRSAAVKHLLSFRKSLRDELGIEASNEFTKIQKWISEGDLETLEFKLKPKNNLPSQQTNFVGRTDGLEQLATLIKNPDCHLISIIGPGGIGKTRLATQSVEENIQHFQDGAFFVPLEPITSGDGIFPGIAKSMDFKFETIASLSSPQSQLLEYLKDLSTILLLDGFEHLTESANQISKILSKAPKIKIIVTSRHKLNVPGEWIHLLDGMKFASSDTNHDNEQTEAIQLFLTRAEQANPGLVIRENDLAAASRICSLLEGLPLGIELAAAWSSVLSFSEIADELSTTYNFLNGQSKTIGKHRNIKAVLSSSWNLLGSAQQEILARLSVFRGSFSRQAATQITNATLTDLSSLLDKSMLRKNQQGEFVMHSVVRHYCRDILRKNDQDWQKVHHNLFQYFADYILRRVPDLYTFNENCTCQEVKNELANLQAAAEFAVLHLDENQEQNILQNLFSYYIIHGWYEGSLAFQQIAKLLKDNQSVEGDKYALFLARTQAQLGFFYSNLGLMEESEEISRSSLPLLEEANQSRELAICIHNLGVNAMFRGEYKLALSLLEQAIATSHAASCKSFASFYLWIGYVHFLLGNYQIGMENFHISLNLFIQDNNDRGTAFAYSKMGLAADGLGHYQEAINYHQKSLKIFRESDNLAGQAYALSRMSLGALLLQDYQTALLQGEAALAEFKKIGHRWGICASFSRIAYAKLGSGKIAEAKEQFFDALSLAHKHQLDPLCLHALAGIACLKFTSGEKKEGLALMKYVQQHPKTPAIYITINRNWFKIEKRHKPNKKNPEAVPKLAVIASKLLEQKN